MAGQAGGWRLHKCTATRVQELLTVAFDTYTPMKKNNRSKLASQYLAALRAQVKQGGDVSAEAAQALGAEAVALGLETLDMARIHEAALTVMVDGDEGEKGAITRQSEAFFTEVIAPIEKTHTLALEATADLDEKKTELGQRTRDLANSKLHLQQQINGRDAAQAALKTSEEASGQLLADSRQLEAHLQGLAHEILASNEEERTKMSLHLQDEIAQTLLGIHVRLLELKQKVAASHANITHEIALTQRLVAQSSKIINRLAHEFGPPT